MFFLLTLFLTKKTTMRYITTIFLAIFLFSCHPKKDASIATKPEEKACAPTSYANNIKTILDESCIKCHTGTKGKAGVDLSTYAGAVAASKGNLYCAISGGNCASMPPFGTKLSADQIKQIDCWIKGGLTE